ncbi:N-acetyltransferase [Bacillus sp. FJAT-42376]|uniref:GNAT family N-acetyltransferase n=1 Tax=Bacillus sp. FJAT-42376 TaxID=2014076 RepID=UPI000F4E8039|nr:GNAT family N-acetyltransferase [Bacillus sp. FJAT-42376]AZB41710.1 N-acetyltransferase [Bacillus sp. FJAT-42376]
MIPIIETKRLILRPYRQDDAERVEELAGDAKVAETTAAIPHPYPKGLASSWIGRHEEKARTLGSYTFAVALKSTDELLGTMTLRIDQDDRKAELGYWFGVMHWGNGYCTEAAGQLVKYAFNQFNLNKIWAGVMTKNTPSIRILQKLGFHHEGTFKEDMLKDGVYEDVAYYGLLKSEYGR